MSELISGKEAAIAYLEGKDVLHVHHAYVDSDKWADCKGMIIDDFKDDKWTFKIKPRTIKINGIEIPAPFKPKEGEACWYLTDNSVSGYSYTTHKGSFSYVFNAVWRSENEIKQVITALWSIFNVE